MKSVVKDVVKKDGPAAFFSSTGRISVRLVSNKLGSTRVGIVGVKKVRELLTKMVEEENKPHP